MQYMIMMFGDAASMMEHQPRGWIAEMIQFMHTLNDDLTQAGDLVAARAAYSQAARMTASVPEQRYLALQAARLGDH